MIDGSWPTGSGPFRNRSQPAARSSSLVSQAVSQSAVQVSWFGVQYVRDTRGLAARSSALGDVGEVAIQPVSAVPSHSQIGCRIRVRGAPSDWVVATVHKSDEHTSELQSLMRISYAVTCL